MVLKKKKKSTYIDSCWFYNVTIAQNHNESKFYTEYLVLIWLVDRLPVLCILLEFWLFFRIFNEIQNFNENQNYKQPYIIQNTSLFYFGLLFFFIRVMGFFFVLFFFNLYSMKTNHRRNTFKHLYILKVRHNVTLVGEPIQWKWKKKIFSIQP